MGIIPESKMTKKPRIPIFYILPKIHKEGFPPRGYSVVLALCSLLEPLPKYWDSFLQPLVITEPTYIRDTKDLINKIERFKPPEEAILVMMDVVCLYRNIPHEEARQVVEDNLEMRHTKSPPTYFFMELTNIISEKIFFRFKEEFFLQMKRVAMGSPFTPSLANLFMLSLEKSVF